MTKSRFNKFLAYWYKRILIFGIITIIIFLIFNFLIPKEFNYNEINIFISLLIASLIVESGRAESRWFAFGVLPGRWMLKELFIGFAIAIISIVIFFGFLYFLGGVLIIAKLPDTGTLTLLLLIIFCSSAAEELIVRGIILQALLDRFGKTMAILTTSFVFGFAHLSNPNLNVIGIINVMIAGIFFSVAYISTRSLWLPISFHFVWNAGIQLFLGSAVSGYNYGYYLMKLDISKFNSFSKWLVGGDFGIEGSIITTIILMLSIFIVLKISHISPYIASIIFKRNYKESELIYNLINS